LFGVISSGSEKKSMARARESSWATRLSAMVSRSAGGGVESRMAMRSKCTPPSPPMDNR
jgi:hypothetical protein